MPFDDIAQKPTAPTMTGGPGDASKAPLPPAPEEPAPPEPVIPEAVPAAAQIIIGNRVFQSKFEADNYLADLEARTRVPVQAPQGYTPVPAQDPSDILFEDPKAALKMLKDNIRQEIRNETSQEQSKRNVWEEFYRTNPDLREFQDIVQMQFSRIAQESPNTPVASAMPNVAAQARIYLDKIRGVRTGGVPLRDGPSRVAGASGSPATPIPIVVAKPTTFLEELQQARKSKNG